MRTRCANTVSSQVEALLHEVMPNQLTTTEAQLFTALMDFDSDGLVYMEDMVQVIASML